MTTSTRFYIENQGVFRETVSREPITPSTDILAQYAGEKANKVSMVMAAEAISPLLHGFVNLVVKGAVLGVTVLIRRLPLRTRFKVHGGCLVPDWGGDSNPMVMEWAVPDDMYLAMLVVCPNGVFSPTAQYLVATDSNGKTYRLPTSNVYEDGKMCTGKYPSTGVTAADMVAKSLQQLEASDWQQDLTASADSGLTPRLFRFKPLEKDGFEQLGYDAQHWTALCRKIGNDTISTYLNV